MNATQQVLTRLRTVVPGRTSAPTPPAAIREVAQRLGVDAGSLHRFSEGSSSSVWAADSPPLVLLAAAPEVPETVVERRVRVGRFLSDRLAFVRPFAGLPQPLLTHGRVVSVWERIDTAPGAAGEQDLPAALARALGSVVAELHRIRPEQLPPDLDLSVADELDDVRTMLPVLAAGGALHRLDHDVLETVVERLDAELGGLRRDRVVVHGDLHRHNVLASRAGGVVLCDTDEVALADPVWDLGFLVDPGRPTLRTAEARAAFEQGYGAALPTAACARTVARAAHLRRTARMLTAGSATRDAYWNRVRLAAWHRMVDDWELDLQPVVALPRSRQAALMIPRLPGRRSAR